MRVRVQVVIEPDDGGPAAVHEVAELERGALQIDTLGLQLAEAKELLRQVQEVVIEEQVHSCLAQQVPCPHCGPGRLDISERHGVNVEDDLARCNLLESCKRP